MSPRGRRSSPTTQLVEYLNRSDNWCNLKDLPTLAKSRLRRAQNSVKRSKDNNDLLEFIGDRVVNLACSLIVDKVKESSDHHMFVGRVLSNNDTLGRIAYQLDLHKSAHLDQRDDFEVTEWNPRHAISPPKALADLFESYAGAVYEEHGWERVMDWLKQIFTPLLKPATEDFNRRSDAGCNFSDSWQSVDQELQDYQERILDYLQFKSKFLTEAARSALDALPASSLQLIFRW